MAKWARRRGVGVPRHVDHFDPLIHGTGTDGIRRWKSEAAAYLREHPEARLSVGENGDMLDVYRIAVRLLDQEWARDRD